MPADRSRKKNVVIVGAGPGGLASAMLLARAGLDVTVLEKRDRVGGRTSAIHAALPAEHGGGPEARPFTFDLGPTFFLYPRILEEVYAMCGLDLHEHGGEQGPDAHGVELTRLDPQYRLLFEGADHEVETVLDCTADPQRMAAEIAKLCPDDATRFPRFLDENRAKFSAFTKVLQRPWRGLTDYLDPQLAAMLPLVRPHSTVDRDLGRYFKDPRVRLAFSFQAKYLGMSPFNCPSLFTILSYLEYDFGVFHPTGGCNAVSTAMAGAAEALGATVELEAAVTAVEFEPGSRRATGVTYTDASGAQHRVHADAVVIGADFAHAMANLVPDRLRKKWTDRKLEKKKFSCSTYMLYLGVEGGPEDFAHLGHHNIFLTRDYPRNLDEIENGHRLSGEPSVYLHHPGHTDPTMAPDGFTSLYVLAPTTHQHGNVDWEAQGPGFRDTLYRQLAKLGLEDLRSRVVYEKVLTPNDWAADLSIFKGATFNLAHNLGQMLHLRPNNRFEDLDGVYLVGGGTHPGSGLPVIYEGARLSAQLVCDDLGVEPGWESVQPKTPTPELVGA